MLRSSTWTSNDGELFNSLGSNANEIREKSWIYLYNFGLNIRIEVGQCHYGTNSAFKIGPNFNMSKFS